MSYKLEMNEASWREYIDAYIWYEEQLPDLGERFAKRIEVCLKTIMIHPEYFAIRKASFREARVKTFPYTSVYEIIKTENVIHIAAIYHSKRNPRKKYRRRK